MLIFFFFFLLFPTKRIAREIIFSIEYDFYYQTFLSGCFSIRFRINLSTEVSVTVLEE